MKKGDIKYSVQDLNILGIEGVPFNVLKAVVIQIKNNRVEYKLPEVVNPEARKITHRESRGKFESNYFDSKEDAIDNFLARRVEALEKAKTAMRRASENVLDFMNWQENQND